MQQTRRVLIQNKKGLHARAAAKLVKTAGAFGAVITIARVPRQGETSVTPVTATSILGVLMLAAEKGSEVDLTATGADAEAALAALDDLISRKFDEGE